MNRLNLILCLLLLSTFTSYSQNDDLQTLYFQATKSLKLFVIKKPLNNAKYNIDDSTFYQDYLLRSYSTKVDTKIFLEIIQNSKQVDTSDWKDTELTGSILMKDSIAKIDLNYVVQKFASNKKLARSNRRASKRFNRHIPDRRYYSMSRPVMDNAHEFAVVNISNNYYGGMLLMFRKVNNVWQEIGMIDMWRY